MKILKEHLATIAAAATQAEQDLAVHTEDKGDHVELAATSFVDILKQLLATVLPLVLPLLAAQHTESEPGQQ
jgi:hypothetical protein